MNAASYIGRVGGLAVALGVGTAIITGQGIAVATADGDTPPNNSQTGDGSGDDTATVNDNAPDDVGKIAVKPSRIDDIIGRHRATDTTPSSVTATSIVKRLSDVAEDTVKRVTDAMQNAAGATTNGDKTTQLTTSRLGGSPSLADRRATRAERLAARTTPPDPTSTDSDADTNNVVANGFVNRAPAIKDWLASPPVAAGRAAGTAPTVPTQLSLWTPPRILTGQGSLLTMKAAPAAPLTANRAPNLLAAVLGDVFNPFAGTAPNAPTPESPLSWMLLAAVRRQLSGAAVNLDPPSPITVSPTLILDPISTEDVTAFYGISAPFPAVAGVVQGKQEFDVVDTITGKTVGTFDALESNMDIFGGTYEELLVTKDLGTGTVGTAAGDTPPVGSVIATYSYGHFGAFYSAMPSPSGDVISVKLVTPFGDIPGYTTYDAAAGLADHSVDNRPVQLTNGYYIAPETPSTENFNAITGLPPNFVAVQGDQVFDVYQADTNAPIGSFDGYVTTTSDAFGDYSEAILVTSDDGSTNVGTAAGQVPPVGSVYNVIYFGNDDTYTLYSSLPSPSGDVISLKLVTPLGVLPVYTTFDASAPPPIQSLSVPGGYSFVPASTRQLAGINGLPPREVIIQGYQQFDVYNSAGTQIGSFDADVTTQSDWFGKYSEAVLVTNDTAGTAGTAAGDVPPVGSVFNFLYYGNSGFGTFYSAMPSPSGDVISYKFVTPFGDIPVYTTYDAAAGLTADSFFDPFLPQPRLGL